MNIHLLDFFYYCSLALIMLSVVFCFIRMVIGPILSDRVVALDLTANLLISFIAVYSVITNQPVYIDVVIALALIVFLTTVAFANLIAWKSTKRIKNKSGGLQ
ncbi:monovalent cation/H+ antiporter complex subunit F [Legionella jamestowniensis]|uniref:Cation:proton antiporter n=1 Tax=Legionella jamestowniensis TaxID=455 RepID=A0A0W0UZD2_9GAMM|nr:monovalent cation/H+ antiporter complex subunit F [Legionella jamestowniensis]KTD13230.1 Na(+)/H(+) antiporter subunit F [Legionella jamestowniensis]OCH98266.1 cation:proton antiporter [Legionella jamestowniensis]SFL78384.1 multisubunit sodium/proton antiporter, MrpF subunit [Legionella jamestowniensis DSM 19215]